MGDKMVVTQDYTYSISIKVRVIIIDWEGLRETEY
jgi:hypothetical protein